jgi:hypothetical protein
MTKLTRHVEDRHGIAKNVPAPQHGKQKARSRTAGKTDYDERSVSKNQGHGHPRDERRDER